MQPIKWNPKVILCLGVVFVLLLVGIKTVFASSSANETQPTGETGELSITLQAPTFEPEGSTGVRLLNETDRYTYEQPEGSPILPHRQYRLALPPDADLSSLQMQIIDVQRESLPGSFNVPLAGPRLLACAPAEITISEACSAPSNSAATTAVFPGLFQFSRASLLLSFSPEVKLLPYGQMRKWRFARLEFSPFQFDAQASALSVARSISLKITYRRDPGLLDAQLLADTVMDDYAAKFFDNFTEAQSQYIAAAQAHPFISTGPTVINDYLIITTDAIYNNSNLGQFMTYLREHGHSVSTVTTSTIAGYTGLSLADKIRHYLKDVYITWGLRYVLLVGNPDPMSGDVPMKMTYPDRLTNSNPTTENPQQQVPTDLYFANLTGDWDLNGDGYAGEAGDFLIHEGDLDWGGVDLTPSVYVGRIPVYNNDYASLNSILQKIEDYENIAHRQTWQNRALLPMNFWGEGYDSATLGYLLETNLLTPNGFSSYSIYSNHPAAAPCNQVSSYPRDAAMADQVVANRWATVPVGLMVWAGHGNVSRVSLGWGNAVTDCWLSGDLFNSGQAASLNDAQPAFTFHNSCLNGKPESANNIGYALLQQGAVATVSASRVTWLDGSGDSQQNLPHNYGSGAGIAYNYVNYLLSGASASESLLWAIGNLSFNEGTNLQNQFDFNLYGEPASVFYVPASANPPATPTNLTVSKTYPDGHQAFKLQWQDNSYNEEFFRISVAAPGSNFTMDVSRNTVAAAVTNVSCGKTYTFQVQAGNRSQLSAATNSFVLDSYPCIPSAPTGLGGALVGATIRLHWNPNADVKDGFNIYRRKQIGNLFTIPFLVGTVGPDAMAWSDNTAQCHSTYSYFVTAFNITGESEPSSSVTINSAICPPPAPTLQEPIPAETVILLMWTDNSNLPSNNEDGFEVWSWYFISGWYKVATLPANTTGYLHTGLMCGDVLAHRYKIVAFNAGGKSESGFYDVQTTGCSTPEAPSNLNANAGMLNKTQIQLTWDDNSDNEWGFKVEQSPNAATWTELDPIAANETGTVVSGLTCDHTYYFRMRAYNTLNSTYSNIDSAATAACDSNEPTHFTATAVSQTQINLAWNKGAGLFDPNRYDIIRANSLRIIDPWKPLASVDAPTTDYQDSNVSCGKTYYYGVRAARVSFPAYTSTYAGPVAATTIVCDPIAPAALTATTASESEIDLSWMAPASGAAVEGYHLERATHEGSDWAQIFTGGADTTTYADGDLACDTEYDYRVQAYNTGGSGPYSSPVTTGKTLACVPSAPIGLNVSEATQDSISLAWTITSTNETGFSIQRSPNGNSGWEEVGTTGAGINAYSDSGLACGMPFVYRVLAFNDSGYSAPSIIVITFTLPCTPSLTATPGQEGLVTLSWVDPGQSTSYYHLERSADGRVFTPLVDLIYTFKSFRDLTAPCGATLYYHISAENRRGSSPFSTPAAMVQTTCKPTTVLALSTATTTIHSILLTWTASEGGQTGFVVERSYDGQVEWIEVANLGAGNSSYVDDNLPPGATFYYRLRAVNPGGSVTSNMASGNTLQAVWLPVINR